MNIVIWILRFAIFLIVFWFALRNMRTVEVDVFGLRWSEAPLILVMLASFTIGAFFGLLLALPSTFRLRRELGRLRKEHARRTQATPIQPEVTSPPLKDYPIQ
jgi:lipopolysaccharide assembly protein A